MDIAADEPHTLSGDEETDNQTFEEFCDYLIFNGLQIANGVYENLHSIYFAGPVINPPRSPERFYG